MESCFAGLQQTVATHEVNEKLLFCFTPTCQNKLKDVTGDKEAEIVNLWSDTMFERRADTNIFSVNVYFDFVVIYLPFCASKSRKCLQKNNWTWTLGFEREHNSVM